MPHPRVVPVLPELLDRLHGLDVRDHVVRLLDDHIDFLEARI